MTDAHICIAHFNEDLDWLKNLKYDYAIISKEGTPLETSPNKGNEASGYLEYIIMNYDNLHDYTIFLHGHRTSWHCTEKIDEKVNNLIINRPYCNINDSVCKERIGMWCEATQQYIPEIINNISLILNEPIHIQNLVYNQAAQFYVHKDLIRRHAKEKYIQLYTFLMDTNILSWLTSRGFEYTWHYVFTGDHHDYS